MQNITRNEAIIAAVLRGDSLQSVGNTFGITRGRVRQIAIKYANAAYKARPKRTRKVAQTLGKFLMQNNIITLKEYAAKRSMPTITARMHAEKGQLDAIKKGRTWLVRDDV